MSRVKNAQEAHEAIRPTSLQLHPSNLPSRLDADLVSLYDLIWRRTCASQMSNAVLEQVHCARGVCGWLVVQLSAT